MFSCEYRGNFKNSYFENHLQATASREHISTAASFFSHSRKTVEKLEQGVNFEYI